MLIAVMVEGQLRMYEQEGQQLEEWGRLTIRRTMPHEAIAQLSADLAQVVGANGYAAVDAEVVVDPPARALPAGRGTGPAAVRLTNASSYHDVGRALELIGPMSVGMLSHTTGMAGPSLSSRLGKLRKTGRARFIDGKWHAIRSDGTVKRPVGRPKGSGKGRTPVPVVAWGSTEVLSLIRSEPGITRDELQRRTRLDRQTLNNRLWSLRDKSTSPTLANTVRVDGDGHCWPLEAPQAAEPVVAVA